VSKKKIDLRKIKHGGDVAKMRIYFEGGRHRFIYVNAQNFVIFAHADNYVGMLVKTDNLVIGESIQMGDDDKTLKPYLGLVITRIERSGGDSLIGKAVLSGLN
jgi:hypothetical protein